MSPPILTLSGIGHTYHGGQRHPAALHALDLSLRAGESLAVLGESGSGKSTLARIACGLLPPTAGTVSLAERPLRAPDRRVQPLFQDPVAAFDPRWTLGASIAEGLGLPWRRARAAVAALLGAMGLGPELADRLPRQCSGGQLQRAALARALAAAPLALVADEPTAALDAPAAAQVGTLLADLRDQGLAVLYLGHDLGLARQLCARMSVLYQGRILETGASDQLWSAPAHPYTQLLWDSVPRPDRPPLRTPDPDPAPAGTTACPFAPRCPYAIARCRSESPALIALDATRSVACHRVREWSP